MGFKSKNKMNLKAKPLEQLVEIETNFIEEAETVKVQVGSEIYEKVFTRKFLGAEIDTKIAMMGEDLKIIERKKLSRDEIKLYLLDTIQNGLAF
ncbi:hypothetical protein [Clostridium magnum]|uniref:Uncharacterized protein n=1 Tax=Clostridium magnum DSM 2767 TaxID=1121326 RepID=A0A161X4S1_9CLOT|nr:hypothetical protein [Clostridium magnum]KZL88926.1 hypothetical protein CLMAG_58300 [Clostridium magnum DSM 2767]SHI53777.1 hypothetical protein SAMN02745944_04477 [Clostridium magnum DSM 2767]